MKLVIASNNKGKIREYKQILEPLGYEVLSQSEAGLILDVEETGTTFAENSALKARAAFKLCGCAVLADDSGLEIDAWMVSLEYIQQDMADSKLMMSVPLLCLKK